METRIIDSREDFAHWAIERANAILTDQGSELATAVRNRATPKSVKQHRRSAKRSSMRCLRRSMVSQAMNEPPGLRDWLRQRKRRPVCRRTDPSGVMIPARAGSAEALLRPRTALPSDRHRPAARQAFPQTPFRHPVWPAGAP